MMFWCDEVFRRSVQTSYVWALSQLTIAKCNKLIYHLSDITDDDLFNANRLARQAQRASRESVVHQRDMIRSNIDWRLAEVIKIIFISFQHGS